jgi:hypothetical protein
MHPIEKLSKFLARSQACVASSYCGTVDCSGFHRQKISDVLCIEQQVILPYSCSLEWQPANDVPPVMSHNPPQLQFAVLPKAFNNGHKRQFHLLQNRKGA